MYNQMVAKCFQGNSTNLYKKVTYISAIRPLYASKQNVKKLAEKCKKPYLKAVKTHSRTKIYTRYGASTAYATDQRF